MDSRKSKDQYEVQRAKSTFNNKQRVQKVVLKIETGALEKETL